MPDPGLPQTLTPWLVLVTSAVAAIGAIGLAARVTWKMFLRPALARAMEDAFRHEFGANGDDHKLPESERGKPLRSLVIASRVDSAATRTRLDDHDQRYAEVNAAQTRLLYEMERHMEHHGPWEAAYDLDRTTRGLPPVEETKSA
jgi:hypothetical protein